VSKHTHLLQHGLMSELLNVPCISDTQDLIDAAKQQLSTNRQRLHRLCAISGMAAPDDSEVHGAFQQALQEWDSQCVAASGSGKGANIFQVAATLFAPPAPCPAWFSPAKHGLKCCNACVLELI